MSLRFNLGIRGDRPMFDQAPEHGDYEPNEPVWHPSGWSPVFTGAEPGRPGAQLIGHTRLRMARAYVRGERVRTFMLTSPGDGRGPPGSFKMHSGLVIFPYQQAGVLIWAWYLARQEDQEHIPDFKPASASCPTEP